MPQKYLPHGTLNQFTNPVQSPNQVTTRVWVPQSQIQNGIQELRLELSMSMQWATNPNPPTYTHSIVGGPRSKSQPKSFGFWLWPSDSGLTKKTFVWLDWLVPLKSNSLTCVLIALNSSSYGNGNQDLGQSCLGLGFPAQLVHDNLLMCANKFIFLRTKFTLKLKWKRTLFTFIYAGFQDLCEHFCNFVFISLAW